MRCLGFPFICLGFFRILFRVENTCYQNRFTVTVPCLVHGLAGWFDLDFPGSAPQILSTAPTEPGTHWCAAGADSVDSSLEDTFWVVFGGVSRAFWVVLFECRARTSCAGLR